MVWIFWGATNLLPVKKHRAMPTMDRLASTSLHTWVNLGIFMACQKFSMGGVDPWGIMGIHDDPGSGPLFDEDTPYMQVCVAKSEISNFNFLFLLSLPVTLCMVISTGVCPSSTCRISIVFLNQATQQPTFHMSSHNADTLVTGSLRNLTSGRNVTG